MSNVQKDGQLSTLINKHADDDEKDDDGNDGKDDEDEKK